jgi:hypothetical protein
MTVFLIVGLNVIVIAVCFLVISARINARLKPDTILEQIRREISSLVLELNQTAEQNIQILEDRIDAMKKLLDQADKRIRVLKTEQEKHSRSTEVYTNILKNVPAPKNYKRSESAAENSPIGGYIREYDTVDEPRTRSGYGADPEIGEQDGRKLDSSVILDLHRKGIASNIIAHRVGSTVGEVELVISLHGRKESE